jgi:hypothetical protein
MFTLKHNLPSTVSFGMIPAHLPAPLPGDGNYDIIKPGFASPNQGAQGDDYPMPGLPRPWPRLENQESRPPAPQN